jgi:hypothetical protein
MGATLGELARAHTHTALQVLVDIAQSTGASDGARVSAANAILDRGYGKPPQALEVSGADGEPIGVDLSLLTPEQKVALASVKLAGE